LTISAHKRKKCASYQQKWLQSRRLGHANASITLSLYGHLIEGTNAAAAKAISGLLGTPRER
jgi:hypothetical protein